MDTESALIVQQLKMIMQEQDHKTELNKKEIQHLEVVIDELKEVVKDQETRLRIATDGVTAFKTWSSLAAGGSSIMSIVALIKSMFFP